MIEEDATVVRVEDGYAIVETQQRAACGSCQSSGSCSTSVLSGLFKRSHCELRVLNPIAAKPGERVIIGLRETALLKVSFLAYLLPLACLLLMAVAAQQLSAHFVWVLGELPTILGGLLGLIIGLLLLRRSAARRATDPNYQAVILRQAASHPVSFV